MSQTFPHVGEEPFWVVFDTSTKPDYYADVHNLVALPEGSVLRYDYRLELLSQSAKDAALGNAPQPSKVLLIYGQDRGFKRGDPTPPEDTPPEDIFWVATRLAELALVFPEGGRAYFDLRLLSYPIQGESFKQVLEGLIGQGDAPFRTWVALSGPGILFENLETGDPHSNWEGIVDLMGTPPSQFAGDSFWRLREPVATRRALKRTEERMERASGAEPSVYQVKSRWHLKEGQTCSIAVVSHTPKDTFEETTGQRYVEISSSGSMLTSAQARVPLRRYTEETIKLSASRSELASPSNESVGFLSVPSRETWPVGPDLRLDFLVEKSKPAIILGFILAALAVAFGVAAAAVDPLFWRIAWGLLAAGLGSAAYFAFTGRLQLPKA